MNPVEQAIIELVHARSAALVRADVPALEQILHPAFTYVNASGQLTDKATYLGRFANPDGGPKWEKQDVSEIAVRVFGDTAIANCRVHDVATWGEYHLDASFRATFVYLKTADGWQCVAGHSSPIEEE